MEIYDSENIKGVSWKIQIDGGVSREVKWTLLANWTPPGLWPRIIGGSSQAMYLNPAWLSSLPVTTDGDRTQPQWLTEVSLKTRDTVWRWFTAAPISIYITLGMGRHSRRGQIREDWAQIGRKLAMTQMMCTICKMHQSNVFIFVWPSFQTPTFNYICCIIGSTLINVNSAKT